MDYIKRLEKRMARLRAKNGCPWDRKQTHRSLKPYLLEEAHEVLEAIDRGDPAHLKEELGDLLLQVVFHAQLARERGRFNLQQVAKTIDEKLVRRHPHVFAGASRKMGHILKRWEELKKEEKPERRSVLDGLPHSLPALLRAQRMHEKASSRIPAGGTRLERELEGRFRALQGALRKSKSRRDQAAGDFLLAFTRLAQEKGIHAEMALRRASGRFEKGFRAKEKRSQA